MLETLPRDFGTADVYSYRSCRFRCYFRKVSKVQTISWPDNCPLLVVIMSICSHILRTSNPYYYFTEQLFGHNRISKRAMKNMLKKGRVVKVRDILSSFDFEYSHWPL